MKKLFLILTLLLLSPTLAHAAGKPGGPRLVGSFDNWRAYEATERGKPVCYMTLTAHFQNAKLHRGDAIITITQRPAENSRDVFSYVAGYAYQPNTDATLRIGRDSFSLFTSQDTAWSRDAATDRKIAAAIRTNAILTITSSPQKGNTGYTDRFNLKGASQAYKAIGKACGMGN